jgi:hypothetical protein
LRTTVSQLFPLIQCGEAWSRRGTYVVRAPSWGGGLGCSWGPTKASTPLTSPRASPALTIPRKATRRIQVWVSAMPCLLAGNTLHIHSPSHLWESGKQCTFLLQAASFFSI